MAAEIYKLYFEFYIIIFLFTCFCLLLPEEEKGVTRQLKSWERKEFALVSQTVKCDP